MRLWKLRLYAFLSPFCKRDFHSLWFLATNARNCFYGITAECKILGRFRPFEYALFEKSFFIDFHIIYSYREARGIEEPNSQSFVRAGSTIHHKHFSSNIHLL